MFAIIPFLCFWLLVGNLFLIINGFNFILLYNNDNFSKLYKRLILCGPLGWIILSSIYVKHKKEKI